MEAILPPVRTVPDGVPADGIDSARSAEVRAGAPGVTSLQDLGSRTRLCTRPEDFRNRAADHASVTSVNAGGHRDRAADGRRVTWPNRGDFATGLRRSPGRLLLLDRRSVPPEHSA